jgi:hypothetical protein
MKKREEGGWIYTEKEMGGSKWEGKGGVDGQRWI